MKPTLQTPWSWTSSLQNCEEMHFLFVHFLSNLFIYSGLCWVFVAVGLTLVEVCRLLITVASLVGEHRL